MKIFSPRVHRRTPSQGRSQGGTSLLELMIAIAIFMIISGAAFTLFQQQPSSQLTLNGQVGLNLALRSTVSQLQMDVINAGNGYYQNANIPSWPVGVTIVNTMNTSGTACNTGTWNEATGAISTYGPSCFDQLNVLVAANSTTYPPVNASDSTGGSGSTNCTSTSSGTGYTQAASGFTLTQTAAEFSSGDELLLVKNTGNPQIAAVVLTAAGAVSGNAVKLQFHATDTYGLNTITPDWLDISACDGIYTEGTSTTCNSLLNSGTTVRFTTSFCGSDWVIKLAPVSYQVCAGPGSSTVPYSCDQTATSPDIADPKLIRTQGGTSTMMMDQIIGFRVGAYLYNSPASGCLYETNNVLCNTSTWPANIRSAWINDCLRSLQFFAGARRPSLAHRPHGSQLPHPLQQYVR